MNTLDLTIMEVGAGACGGLEGKYKQMRRNIPVATPKMKTRDVV